jgi:glycosyltransferase involved in cell wall biosynthesis
MIAVQTDAHPEISAVIPCLNESENAASIAAAVAAQFQQAGVSYEIIFIDNGSTDGTVDIVRSLCANDPRVRLIVNNQNYGQMRSPTHGIYQAMATGAIIGISADFQDPPEMIGPLISRWRAGAMIVLGVRRSEKASFALRFVRSIGYGFFERFGDYRVIPGATGFGLYDRRVVDCLRRWRDPEPFFRGMLVESGFSLATISYDRPERAAGVSKNNLLSLLGFAVSGLASSSKKLLRLPIYLSMLGFVVAFATMCLAIILGVLRLSPWAALTWAAAETALSLILFFLGLMGEQIRLISDIARNTPLVIEKERINFPSEG